MLKPDATFHVLCVFVLEKKRQYQIYIINFYINNYEYTVVKILKIIEKIKVVAKVFKLLIKFYSE